MKDLCKQLWNWLEQEVTLEQQSFDFRAPAVHLPAQWKVPAYLRKGKVGSGA